MTWGIIHVYNYYFQRSSSLKHDQSVKFYRKHLHEGRINVIINKPGHMTKMAAMLIYGKNPSKILFVGTAEPIAAKIDM